MRRLIFAPLVLVAALCVAAPASAQNQPGNGNPNTVAVQLVTPFFATTPISATAAVNTATTLTIPAPPAGLYNYVCWLAYQANSDGTGAAVSNAVTTSTNFNSFALKVSFPATVSIDSGVQAVLGAATPGAGCVKSTASGTATTFVSPASLTHVAFTWYATYYQAQ